MFGKLWETTPVFFKHQMQTNQCHMIRPNIWSHHGQKNDLNMQKKSPGSFVETTSGISPRPPPGKGRSRERRPNHPPAEPRARMRGGTKICRSNTRFCWTNSICQMKNMEHLWTFNMQKHNVFFMFFEPLLFLDHFWKLSNFFVAQNQFHLDLEQLFANFAPLCRPAPEAAPARFEDIYRISFQSSPSSSYLIFKHLILTLVFQKQ